MAGIKDYSPVPASNTALFPEGMAPSAVNDGMRQVQADIRAEVASKGADIASAETVDLGAATGDFVDVTGTTTIISFGTVSAGIRRTVRFTGALTLTHNSASLILPGGANLTTADGDIARFRSLGSGDWVCEFYSKADGQPISQVATASIADEAVTAGKIAEAARLPPGMVAPFAMDTAPTGWLECDGNNYSRTTYADLFAAIKTTFGEGDGSTTFSVPDFRGEFIRGWDNGRGVDSGRAFASFQQDALQGHNHYLARLGSSTSGTTMVGIVSDRSNSSNVEGLKSATDYDTDVGLLATKLATDTANGTPRIAAETRPRNRALMYCIKY